MMFPLNHDLHCHSTLSHCCHDPEMTPHRILEHAVGAGYDTICLTNHLWDNSVPGASPWYSEQDIAHNLLALPLPQAKGTRFCLGCEIEYVGNGRLGLAREHFDMFDFIIISVNHMHMEGLVRPVDVQTAAGVGELFTQRLEEVAAMPGLPWHKVGIAHLNIRHLYRPGKAADVLKLCDKRRLAAVFERLATLGAGVELNASAFADAQDTMDTHIELFRLARDRGCRFYCASDAHTVKALDLSALKQVLAELSLQKADRFGL